MTAGRDWPSLSAATFCRLYTRSTPNPPPDFTHTNDNPALTTQYRNPSNIHIHFIHHIRPPPCAHSASSPPKFAIYRLRSILLDSPQFSSTNVKPRQKYKRRKLYNDRLKNLFFSRFDSA
ncbi:hypothetical protein HGRIS_005701 [Hohenbuehelia grisea]|uniref:Uncharacterized protein n=1 Tax=Hohenbuehelia grisea TaxID=104357 RepID=A0ABR3JXX0_9AGAR